MFTWVWLCYASYMPLNRRFIDLKTDVSDTNISIYDSFRLLGYLRNSVVLLTNNKEEK